jgi:hypothetical protein
MEKEGSLVPVAAGRGQASQASAHTGTQVISDVGAGMGANPRVETTPKVGTSSPPPTDIEQQSAAQLLAQLDQLSDQDVDRLLSQMLSEEEKRNKE